MLIDKISTSMMEEKIFLNKRSLNHCLNYQPYCECKTTEKVECRDFRNFTELNFKMKHQYIPNYKRIHYFKLHPQEPIKFDNSLDLGGLNFDHQRLQLILNNFNGIQLESNPFNVYIKKSIERLGYTSNDETNFLFNKIIMNNFTFKFFYRQSSDFNWICDLIIKDAQLKPLFSSFRTVILGFLNYINYETRLCPVIFKDAKIESLYFYNLTTQNRPNFLDINLPIASDNSDELNSVVKTLHIQWSEISLDENLLNKNVFKNLEKLSLEFCTLISIEKHTFKELKNMQFVSLWLFNLQQFFQSSDNEWFRYLNYKSDEVNLNELTHSPWINLPLLNYNGTSKSKILHKQMYIEFNDENATYTYPDGDFCLFKYFPHSKLVFPIVNSNRPLNCTCTLVWLLKHSNVSMKNIQTESVSSCFKSAEYFNRLVWKCDFTRRIRKCFNHKAANLINDTMSSYLKAFVYDIEYKSFAKSSRSNAIFLTYVYLLISIFICLFDSYIVS